MRRLHVQMSKRTITNAMNLYVAASSSSRAIDCWKSSHASDASPDRGARIVIPHCSVADENIVLQT